MVSAVEDGSGEAAPSRFIGEIAAALGAVGAAAEAPEPVPVDPGVDRVLSLPSLVAALRAEVLAGVGGSDQNGSDQNGSDQNGSDQNGGAPTPRAQAAAELLARLADLDIPGAHPRDWFGLAQASTDEPLWVPCRRTFSTVSSRDAPSTTTCSISRWVCCATERSVSTIVDAAL